MLLTTDKALVAPLWERLSATMVDFSTLVFKRFGFRCSFFLLSYFFFSHARWLGRSLLLWVLLGCLSMRRVL
jgi:hypothetical protein